MLYVFAVYMHECVCACVLERKKDYKDLKKWTQLQKAGLTELIFIKYNSSYSSTLTKKNI